MTPNRWLAWCPASRADAERTARAAAEQHGLDRADVRIRPSFDGNGWEVWTR